MAWRPRLLGYLAPWLLGYLANYASLLTGLTLRKVRYQAVRCPQAYPTRTREYLISWPMGARLMAISRRLVAIWFLAIWLYGLGVWWPKLLAMWLT